MVKSWIFQQNLEAFLEMLEWIAGERLERSDYNAIAEGIVGTNQELGNWFEFGFCGKKRSIVFKVGDDPGSAVSHFEVTIPVDAVELVEFAFLVASENDIKRHNSFA